MTSIVCFRILNFFDESELLAKLSFDLMLSTPYIFSTRNSCNHILWRNIFNFLTHPASSNFSSNRNFPYVTSGSRCYKISMKNSKCAVSNKHIQDGRPGRYEKRRRTKKRTNRPPRSPRHPKAPGGGWKESETQCGAPIIQENVGRDPSESRCNMSVNLCKNPGTFLKMPEEPSWRCPRN